MKKPTLAFYTLSLLSVDLASCQSDNPATTTVSGDDVLALPSAPFPTATDAQCENARGPDDPSASEIAQALAAENAVSKACDVETQSLDTIGNLAVISYGLEEYFFNITRLESVVSRPIASPDQCPESFNTILETCVTGGSGNFWGGSLQMGIVTDHGIYLLSFECALVTQADIELNQSQIVYIRTTLLLNLRRLAKP